MSDADNFVGFWKVLNCTPIIVPLDTSGIQGTLFELSSNGDVTWKTPEGAVSTPLFECDTFVYKKLHKPNFLFKFGSYKGHIIECTVRKCDHYMIEISIHIGQCVFICKKLEEISQDPFEVPFSFLPALQDSYFSDLTIKCDNNKEFKVHSTILKLTAPEVDWSAKVTPLSNLPEDVTFAILYFLYAQCLYSEVSESTVHNIISPASQIPGLSPLVSLCHRYIRNCTLKRKIFGLISDIHGCASQIESFTFKQLNSRINNLTIDPSKLCFAVKSSIREAIVAAAKILMICDLYTRQKPELSIEDKHEIIFFAKSRVPVFINQLESFLQTVKNTFSNFLPSERQDLASYLAPELDNIYDTTSSLLIKMRAILEKMLAESEKEDFPDDILGNLEQYTDYIVNNRELDVLQGVVFMISCILLPLQRIKEEFKLTASGNKIQFVVKILEHLMEKLPIFVWGIEEFISTIKKKLQGNEFQFCFNIGSSQVSEGIKKFLVYKESLQDFMTDLCELVQRDAFSQTMTALGLLESSVPTAVSSSGVIQKEENNDLLSECDFCMPNSSKSICISPPANQNHLSEAACELLKSGQETDMIFEIVSTETDITEDLIEGVSVESTSEPKPEPQEHKIGAHRVIVASRCDWFRRALLSGMKEDITRKIQVFNTNPLFFSLFLQYLYTGKLNCSALSADEIFELLLLSDRYELDCLKQMCEFGLKSHLDPDVVLYFYNMADKFNAKILKSACEKFIVDHPEVIDSEVFEELPENLQSEIYDIITSSKPHSLDYPLKSCKGVSWNVSDLKEMIASVHINSNPPTPDSDEMPLSQDFPRLEAAVEQLREIIGQEAPRSQLVQVILAADYDVNRALNFYYSCS